MDQSKEEESKLAYNNTLSYLFLLSFSLFFNKPMITLHYLKNPRKTVAVHHRLKIKFINLFREQDLFHIY